MFVILDVLLDLVALSIIEVLISYWDRETEWEDRNGSSVTVWENNFK